MKKAAESLAESGKTPLYFAKGNRLLGVIAVADVIKEDSPQAIRELREMGVEVVMLTGDNERTARAIGAQAGVDRRDCGRAAGRQGKCDSGIAIPRQGRDGRRWHQ